MKGGNQRSQFFAFNVLDFVHKKRYAIVGRLSRLANGLQQRLHIGG